MNLDHIKTIDTLMLEKPKMAASYLIGKNEFALVESGTHASAEFTYQNLLNIPYFDPERVKYILTTHIHLDHSGGVSALLKHFPNAKIIHHHKTTRHLEDPTRLWESSFETNSYTASLYGKPDSISSETIIPSRHGDVFEVDGLELGIIDAPGHHSYHHAILERKSNVLFVGDSCGWFWNAFETIFPTTPPPRFDFKLYKDTINNHIKLDPKYLAFTHFDIIKDNIEKILWNSIEVATDWVEIIKEYRSKNTTITVNETVNTLIKEKYPAFQNAEKGMKDVIFGISTLGIFNYLDKLETTVK